MSQPDLRSVGREPLNIGDDFSRFTELFSKREDERLTFCDPRSSLFGVGPVHGFDGIQIDLPHQRPPAKANG